MRTDAPTPGDNATPQERMELAHVATVMIGGLADALLTLVRASRVDSDAPTHHAVLGMLAQIESLTDDIFGLLHGDRDEVFTRAQVRALMRKMGITELFGIASNDGATQ